MKVLLVNKFLYPKGGDTTVTLSTGKLLSEKGHKVIFWGMDYPLNPEYPYKDYFVSYIDFNKPMNFLQQFRTILRILYSLEAKKKIEKLIERERPDIVHLNNFAHQISPSILDVFKKYKISTIMTMHDYKLACPSYSMLLNGNPCEECEGSKYYRCFINKCTKNSYVKSLINTLEMYLHHKMLHIYNKIDTFISPSKFLMNKVKEMGFKEEIFHLPNFIDTKDYEPKYDSNNKTICYFGRVSREKGLFTLTEAVKNLRVKLKIVGEGPLEESLKLKVESEKIDSVDFLGYKKGGGLKEEIRESLVVILPSEWYENNPRIVLEAFALGKPVIGARIGGIPELVRDGETGLTFEPGKVEDLKDKIEYSIRNAEKISKMGRNAREFVEKELNPEKHYKQLMEIYQIARDKHS